MATSFLVDGPETAKVTLLIAHGAGAAMDSPSMTLFAEAFGAAGLRVIRFEFGYMAARREGHRRPPPRAEKLIGEFKSVVAEVDAQIPLLIGGKSMGGRVASMAANDLYREGKIAGLVCLGYPFHPPAKPTEIRTAHLEELKTPALIFQGTRDPFGTQDEVVKYNLSNRIEIVWMGDGDHDLKPRKKTTGATAADYAAIAAGKVADWAGRLE
ncbi:MAG: alpha/beta hydrolase [Silicimonas sp.]|nr:alpha/beta hydrolase [Silicimonas sp.]